MKNIFGYTKTFIGKVVAFLAAIVVIMTFVDFLLKWQIYTFLLSVTNKLFEILSQFAFEAFILLWLVLLSYLFWRLHKQVKDSKPNELHEEITNLKSTLEAQIKKLSETTNSQIKTIDNRINNKVFDIEYTLVKFEIERYRSKNQVGEVAQMIKKLDMDSKRGWGFEDTLLEIKEYIKKSGMPSYFLDDLHKSLEKLPDSVKGFGDETLKLAQERLYNPK